MAEIGNLRGFAKKKHRQAKATKAARNRAAFGRSKPDRAALERQKDALDGKKLDRPAATGDDEGGRG